MEIDNLDSLPDFWLPVTGSLDPLSAQIASLQHTSAKMEQFVTIRFKNRYGVQISHNVFNGKLYSVVILRFFGRHLENYCLVKNSHFSSVTWFLSSSEVLSICEQVAHWDNSPAQS